MQQWFDHGMRPGQLAKGRKRYGMPMQSLNREPDAPASRITSDCSTAGHRCTSMQMGTADGTVCTATVSGNLVTAYSSGHNGDFSDEISSCCHIQNPSGHSVVNTLPRTPYALIGLAMAAFAIGTSEFVIMGLLPEVAADLSVSIPQAGLLVTGYALGVVIGAPILAIITAKLPRRETKPQKRRTQHRGITETSGHKTDAMLDLYGHEVAVVEPARAGESEREFYRQFYRGGNFVVASNS